MKFRSVFYTIACICLFWIALPLNIHAAEEGPYVIKFLSYKDSTKIVVLKYDKRKGATWVLSNGGFQEIKEKKEINPSIYQVELVAVHQGWDATRIDTRTGRTWTIKDGSWVEF